MSKTLSTKCDDSKISIAMDDLSYPHCVWIEDNQAKYSRFYAGEWRNAGDQSVVLSSENTIQVSKNCIGFDDSGNPFFALLDGNSISFMSWNGSSWTREVAWTGTTGEIPLTWSVTWAGFYVLVVVVDDSESKTIYAVDKSSGSWGIPEGILIPDQDNTSIELKISKVAFGIYSFWTGKNESLGTSWIGHAIWDLNTQEWLYTTNKQIELSTVEGDIAGIDFVVNEELMSSESSD
jgi:hypothetical protein